MANDIVNFVKELKGNKTEGQILKNIFISLITSFGIFMLFYLVSFRNIENFMSIYGLWLIIAIIGFSFLTTVIAQVREYGELACMVGMVVGMTTGMLSGFLIGFVIATTNGMFYGTLTGVIVGITIGVWMGKCCGIMGIIEGILAGFMGGIMGAMTSLMLYNENLKFIGILILIVTIVTFICLNYLIYKEMKNYKPKKSYDIIWTFLITFLFVTFVMLIVVVGPRSGIVSVSIDNNDNDNIINTDEVQEITISFQDGNYYPQEINVKVNIPVEITLDSSVRGCLRAFTINDLGVSEVSSGPDDKIIFTPKKTGTFTFMCSMGMGYGRIIVS